MEMPVERGAEFGYIMDEDATHSATESIVHQGFFNGESQYLVELFRAWTPQEP